MDSNKRTLTKIVCDIRTLQEAIDGREKKNLSDAIKIGELLIECRTKKKAGKERDYKRWVNDTFKFSYFQATKYLRLFEFRQSIDNDPKESKRFDQLGLMEAYVVAGISKKDDELEQNGKGNAGSRRNKSGSAGEVSIDPLAPKIIHRDGKATYLLVIPEDKKNLNDIRPFIGAAMENEQFLSAIKAGLMLKMEGK